MSAADTDPTSVAHPVVANQAEVVTSADFGRELKRIRHQCGETQEQSATAIGVSRANLTQWETGKYLPSAQNARQLDDHFRSGNALVNLAETARSLRGPGTAPVAKANFAAQRPSLLHVFHQVGRGLVEHVVRDEQGRPTGWRHNLNQQQQRTALGTAYGIRTMLVVGEPYVDLDALTASLLGMRSADGEWRGRSGISRTEITAGVLDALFRIGSPLTLDEALDLSERSLDPFSRTRSYLLATVLQTVVRLRPDAPLALGLIDDLLAARLDGTPLWPEKNEAGLVRPEPSVAHTARAVVVLQEALRYHEERNDIQEAVGKATQWLTDQVHRDDGVIEELIRPRPDGHGKTRVMIRHFTSAWVVQALAAMPQVPLSRLHRALRKLWERYDAELGLWAWGNGDVPIWMTLDAVTALNAATRAVSEPPLSPPEKEGQ
jgi:DNA-binding XRE family transcriptional regulator